MKLLQFQVFNYRSVNDSGPIEVRKQTALVGRNESGKTNLLLALQSLNPPEGMKELSYVKDFPRDRHINEFSKDLKVVETRWGLSDEERCELARIFPRAMSVSEVVVGRWYKDTYRWVSLLELPPIKIGADDIKTHLTKIKQSVNGGLKSVTVPEQHSAIMSALESFVSSIDVQPVDIKKWATETATTVNRLRDKIKTAGFTLPDVAAENVAALDAQVTEIVKDDSNHSTARQWILQQLPVFIYLHEYPDLQGHQNIPEYITRNQQNKLSEADENFIKLCKVAGLDPVELNRLLQEDHETRQQLVNRAGSVVTKKIRQLWTDRELTIRFNLDANHFDTLVSDPQSYYPVEINLNERSRGLKWFFSFYITFAADTAGGPAEDAIILLDEPGLHLHAIAQRNLLNHFAKDFNNTIIYTTHSPFMIPVDNLASIRTLNIAQDAGTTVTNDPTGDDKTLFPIQAALGYDISQSLFIGKNNLVVEGVSDFWYLSAMSEYLLENKAIGLPEHLVITPAGGAPKVSYMVTLLTSQRLNVLVLLDAEHQGFQAAKNIIKSKLIREQNVVFVNEIFGPGSEQEADIEDLLGPDKYGTLVNEIYANELRDVTLILNDNIPRIVKRYEDAFEKAGLTFNKMRPAKLFLRRIVDQPNSVVSDESAKAFGSLFSIIAERMRRHEERRSGAFS